MILILVTMPKLSLKYTPNCSRGQDAIKERHPILSTLLSCVGRGIQLLRTPHSRSWYFQERWHSSFLEEASAVLPCFMGSNNRQHLELQSISTKKPGISQTYSSETEISTERKKCIGTAVHAVMLLCLLPPVLTVNPARVSAYCTAASYCSTGFSCTLKLIQSPQYSNTLYVVWLFLLPSTNFGRSIGRMFPTLELELCGS